METKLTKPQIIEMMMDLVRELGEDIKDDTDKRVMKYLRQFEKLAERVKE